MYTKTPFKKKESNYFNIFLKETIKLLYRSLDRAPANDEACLRKQQCYSFYSWKHNLKCLTLDILVSYPEGTVSFFPMV
jgi:hypothetical protein